MSTIKTETLSTPSNATVPVDTVVNGTAKAWVNFNGTGTVAIRRAFNVASITDNGTGTYAVNFTVAMPDVNYGASCFVTDDSSSNRAVNEQGTFGQYRTASAIRVTIHNTNGTGGVDAQGVSVAIFS